MRDIDAARLAHRLAGDLQVNPALLTRDDRRANLDQVQSFIRDYFDELGLTIIDVDVLAVVLATLALVVQSVRNGVGSGVTDMHVGLEVEAFARALATALQPYLDEVPA